MYARILVSVADGSILVYGTWKYVDDGKFNETIIKSMHLARKCKPIVRVTIILGEFSFVVSAVLLRYQVAALCFTIRQEVPLMFDPLIPKLVSRSVHNCHTCSQRNR